MLFCPICYEDVIRGKDEFLQPRKPVVWTACGHVFHAECSDEVIKQNKSNNVCARCPICTAQGSSCVRGYCGQNCPLPYVRLFIQEEETDGDNGTPLQVELDPATGNIVDAAKLAHEFGLAVEKLQGKMDMAIKTYGYTNRWVLQGAWPLNVKTDKEIFEKLVRECQKKTGMERLEEQLNEVVITYKHFLTIADLSKVMDKQQATIDTLERTAHSNQQRLNAVHRTELLLQAAEAKMSLYDVTKKRDMKLVEEGHKTREAEWKVKEEGYKADVMRLLAQAEGESSKRVKLESEQKQVRQEMVKLKNESFESKTELQRLRRDLNMANAELSTERKKFQDLIQQCLALKNSSEKFAQDFAKSIAAFNSSISGPAAPAPSNTAAFSSSNQTQPMSENVGRIDSWAKPVSWASSEEIMRRALERMDKAAIRVGSGSDLAESAKESSSTAPLASIAVQPNTSKLAVASRVAPPRTSKKRKAVIRDTAPDSDSDYRDADHEPDKREAKRRKRPAPKRARKAREDSFVVSDDADLEYF